MTVTEFIARARSQIGKKAKYRLGGGKIIPAGSTKGLS